MPQYDFAGRCIEIKDDKPLIHYYFLDNETKTRKTLCHVDATEMQVVEDVDKLPRPMRFHQICVDNFLEGADNGG